MLSNPLITPAEQPRPRKSITGEELLNLKIEEMPCLIEPILPKVGSVALAGSSDCSKSTILRELGIAVSTQKRKFLGWDINAIHHSAIYVSTEDDENSIAYLLNKQNKQVGLENGDYKSLRYVFDTENLLQTLDEELQIEPADVIIIDAFSDLFFGSINDSTQVRSFLNAYNQLAKNHKCLIIWLHHTGKRTDESAPTKHNLLGSQGFEAKMRVVIELRKDRTDPQLRHFCIVKGNYLPEEYKSKSYVLRLSENMTFSNTGDRVPLTMLCQNNEKEAKIQQVVELSEQGYTQQEIADEMGYKNKSSVSRLLNESKQALSSE